MRAEEVAAFAARLGASVDDIVPFDLIASPISYEAVTRGVDVVLVGGSGAYSVFGPQPWGGPFVDVMGELADRGFPTFASCFGFQALVMALGGDVQTDPDGAEVGSYDLATTAHAAADPVFGALPPAFVGQEGHKDRAMNLPDRATWLVSSARCPYQALRVAGAPVWATQFHPELTATENRERFMRYYDLYAKAFGASEADDILRRFRESPESNGLLRRFADWVRANA